MWNYLRVHLTRILHKDVMSRVQAQEEMYRTVPGMIDSVHNRRMSWFEYKEVITYLLPKGTGLHVLTKVLTLKWEEDETAASWCIRMHKGRRRVFKDMDTNLSDACYR